MQDCENEAQMKSYYEVARSFDTKFPSERLKPNCQTYKYIPHDYFTDYNYEELDSSNQSMIMVVFTSFYKQVGILCDNMYTYLLGNLGISIIKYF